MAKSEQSFGGDWTDEKLERVRKYLAAYVRVVKVKGLRFAYIDAFAGTGYRELKNPQSPQEPLFPGLTEPEPVKFLDGSARIALQVSPPFDKYIFIEKHRDRFQELGHLKAEFQDLAPRIELVNEDANPYLQNLAGKEWRTNRAVVFLDPFGMQVDWETIAALAGTQAVDLWILFPLGVAVNRLLKRDGRIEESLRKRLDRIFGASDWYDAFYSASSQLSLIGEETERIKIADFEQIAAYFVRRLKGIFAGVAENPLPLMGPKNYPLYLFCFASSNPKGTPTALKIAEYILRRK